MLSGLHIEVCISETLQFIPRGQAQAVLMLRLVLWGVRVSSGLGSVPDYHLPPVRLQQVP